MSDRAHAVSIDYSALLEVFLDESEEAVSAMEEALLILEAHPGDDEPVQTLFRLVHTLKGNAASLSLTDLATFAHSLEDILDSLRSDTITVSDELVTVLLESVDVVREMLDAAAEGAR